MFTTCNGTLHAFAAPAKPGDLCLCGTMHFPDMTPEEPTPPVSSSWHDAVMKQYSERQAQAKRNQFRLIRGGKE